MILYLLNFIFRKNKFDIKNVYNVDLSNSTFVFENALMLENIHTPNISEYQILSNISKLCKTNSLIFYY